MIPNLEHVVDLIGVHAVGEEVSARSIVGGRFLARISDRTECGDRTAVRTSVSGRAWIHGRHTVGVHPDDPFAFGYTLSDTRRPGTPR